MKIYVLERLEVLGAHQSLITLAAVINQSVNHQFYIRSILYCYISHRYINILSSCYNNYERSSFNVINIITYKNCYRARIGTRYTVLYIKKLGHNTLKIHIFYRMIIIYAVHNT